MRRWSLSRKILGLAIVNLFLLAALMLAYARMQYRFGAESLLMGPARDRVLGVANAFRIDMDGTPDVAALLRSYSQRYQAEFFLISPRGHALAGDFSWVQSWRWGFFSALLPGLPWDVCPKRCHSCLLPSYWLYSMPSTKSWSIERRCSPRSTK